jgi:tetratricopeptide (TPR) repeat protein
MNLDGAGAALGIFAVFVIGLIIMAYPFYRLGSLWLDRVLSTSEWLLYTGTLGLLVLGFIATFGTPLGWLVLAAMLFACCGVPLLNQLGDRRALRRMQDEDIASYLATLTHQPSNLYVRERLARLYIAREQWAEALQQLKQALYYEPENKGLKLLAKRAETALRRQQTGSRPCPKCMTENPGEVMICLKCGYYFIDPGDILHNLLGKSSRQAVLYGGLGTVALALLGASCGMPPVVSIALFAVGITVVFWSLYLSLRGPG